MKQIPYSPVLEVLTIQNLSSQIHTLVEVAREAGYYLNTPGRKTRAEKQLITRLLREIVAVYEGA
jgi:hypothetical protein